MSSPQPVRIEADHPLVPLVQSSAHFCLLVDVSGNILAASGPAAARGVDRAHGSLVQLVAEDERERLAHVLAQGTPPEPHPFVLPVGEHSIFGSLTMFAGLAGGPIGLFLALEEQDTCSAKPDAEVEGLREQVEILRAAFDTSFDGLYVTDSQGNMLLTNRSYERATGLVPSSVAGINVGEMLRKGMINRSATMEAIRQGRPVTTVVQVRNGNRLITTANPLLDENGMVKYVVGNARRIADLLPVEAHWLPILPETNEARNGDNLRLWNEFVAAQHAGGQAGALIGNTAAFREVIATSIRAAEFDTPVLIQGESGVGKGLLANLIHHMSVRRDASFVEVNCGAIPETLLESELFGYEKGAFTDARSEGKKGVVETANHGTLFLDEISELPLPLQVKLLKFLDDMSFMPVGGVNRRTVQVKIIAASNVDLEALVRAGRFRQDLFFRLNVLPITIPPLRERREDIPLLVEYFLKVFEKRNAKAKRISSEAMIALMHNDYSGNVRELRNVIERVFIMTPGESIELLDLPASLRARAGCTDTLAEKRNLHELLRDYEKRIIENAIRQYRTTYDAAAALGVNQSTIVRKLQSYRRVH